MRSEGRAAANTTQHAEIVQYEITGLERDRDMIRLLAHRLSEGGTEAERVRDRVSGILGGRGGIVAALLRSPLRGAYLDLTRDHAPGRQIDL